MQTRSTRIAKRRLVLERLEDRNLFAISDEEQFLVYRINYARDNPVRYQTEQNLPVDLGYVIPRQPLAVIDSLFASSEAKVNDLIANNYFAHLSPSGINANRLVRNYGYELPATLAVGGTNYSFPDSGNAIESLAAGYTTVNAALDGLIVDQGVSPPGHRNHLLGITGGADVYNEIGTGYAFGNATTYRNYWSIHAATRSTSVRYVTGVVYNDANSNSRYDQREGLAGVTVRVIGTSLLTTTNAAGGWSIAIDDGEYEIQAEGGAFSGVSTVPVRINGRSEEVDFRSGQLFGQFSFDNWMNTAPLLSTTANPTLSPVFVNAGSSNSGAAIASLIQGAITDSDPVARRGIAVTSLTNTNGGTWQYRVGSTWQSITNVSLTSALLLRDNDQIRYLGPTAVGNDLISFRAWDQTSGVPGDRANLVTTGTGGSTSFSSAEETASIASLTSNRSPVLTSSSSTNLPSIPEDTTNSSGVLLSTLLGLTAVDADTGTQLGIGLSAVGGNGSWQYSLDGRTTWQNVQSPAGGQVLPLRGTDWIRFTPVTDFAGTSTIDYLAWDQFLGQSGVMIQPNSGIPAGHQSSFSVTSNRATITITPVNDSPIIEAGREAWLQPIAQNSTFSFSGGTLVSDMTGQIVSDIDLNALYGIAVIGTTGNGTWWFQNNGNWSSGTTSNNFAWVLKSTDRVQFVPASGFTGTATIMFRAWDQTTGPENSGRWTDLSSPTKYGGITAYSQQTQMGKIFVGTAGASPLLTSVSRVDPNPGNTGATVRWNVIFSESVSNVNMADFRIQTTGTANGVVTSVSGSGSSYVIAISQISGIGTIGLSIAVSQDIRDSVGNRLTATTPNTNETYDVVASVASVVNRQVFYNRSNNIFFGDGSGNPSSSIDTTKVALRPGQVATAANYTNYVHGLNGILVDIVNVTNGVQLNDLEFATWSGVTPGGFVPLPSTIVPVLTSLPGVGVNGSLRLKIELPNGAVVNTWLRIVIKANARTGLATDDVFYFGNAAGEVNRKILDLRINGLDLALLRRSISGRAANISSNYDIDKDGKVTMSDYLAVRQRMRAQTILGRIRV